LPPALGSEHPWRFRLTPAASCVLAALLGFGLTLLVFQPGFMSPDSFNQLLQGRTEIYNSEHPPLMAWLWGRLDSLFPGPLPMLILQNAMFWSGLALVLGLTVRPALAPIAVLVIGLFPTNLALLSTVWKDVQMGASLLLAFGLILQARSSHRRWMLWAALVPLWYACAVRHNGAVSSLPLFWLWSSAFWERSVGRRLLVRSMLTTAGVLAAVVASVLAVNGALTRHVSRFEFQEAPLHDLVAMSLMEKQSLLPPYLQSGPDEFPLERMRELYHHGGVTALYYPRTPGPRLTLSTSSSEMRILVGTWFAAILAHPMDYLSHRLAYCRALLGGEREVCYPFHSGIDANSLGLSWDPPRGGRFVLRQLESVRNSLAFRGWFLCLCIALALLVGRFRPPADPVPFQALAASALLNVIPFLVFGPNCDFRFLWWTGCCALLLPAIGWGKAVRVRRDA